MAEVLTESALVDHIVEDIPNAEEVGYRRIVQTIEVWRERGSRSTPEETPASRNTQRLRSPERNTFAIQTAIEERLRTNTDAPCTQMSPHVCKIGVFGMYNGLRLGSAEAGLGTYANRLFLKLKYEDIVELELSTRPENLAVGFKPKIKIELNFELFGMSLIADIKKNTWNFNLNIPISGMPQDADSIAEILSRLEDGLESGLSNLTDSQNGLELWQNAADMRDLLRPVYEAGHRARGQTGRLPSFNLGFEFSISASEQDPSRIDYSGMLQLRLTH